MNTAPLWVNDDLDALRGSGPCIHDDVEDPREHLLAMRRKRLGLDEPGVKTLH